MSDWPFQYTIWSPLPPRRESPAEIGTKFLHTIDALSRIDPLFADWEVLDLPAMKSLPLRDARPRIAEIVENNVVRNDYGHPLPKSGYNAIGVTENVITTRIVRLDVDAGAVFGGDARLEFGGILNPTDPLIVSYPLFRSALLTIATNWQPPWAYACAFRRNYWEGPIVPGAPRFRHSPFHIPWIAYVSPRLSKGFVVPPPDVRTEHAPGGGLLLSATKERFEPLNPDHLRRAHILAETMIACTGDKFSNENPD
jgi:hypothetical protein